MNKYIYLIIGVLAISPLTTIAQNITPSNDKNYILTQAPQVPKTSLTNNNTAGEVISNITYYDGLGRPIQSIGIAQSGSGKDVITPVEYDLLGRATKSYLPYTKIQSNGAYRSSAISEVGVFYNTAAFNNASQPFSEKLIENSPLNRLEGMSYPGKHSDNWITGGTRQDNVIYATNVEGEVNKYLSGSVDNPVLTQDQTYPANSLAVTINEDGNNHITKTFTNKSGQVILSRTYVGNETHDTYNVYDDYGSLTFVLNPKASESSSPTSFLNSDIFQYQYNDRLNRMTSKKVPGKGLEEYVYDKLNRVVLIRDTIQASNGEWLFTKYDAFDRVAYTGIYNSSQGRSSLQSTLDSLSVHNVTRSSLSNNGVNTGYYTNDVWPTSGLTLQTLQYYDDYSACAPASAIATATTTATTSTVPYGVTACVTAKGLPTVAKTKLLDGSNIWITAVTYYDIKSRVIKTFETNMNGGHTWVNVDLDWAGRVLETTTQHKRESGNSYTTVVSEMEYDNQARLISETMEINGGSEELIAKNHYNEIGQLSRKDVGNTVASPLQKINYSYNIRGWMTDINDVNQGQYTSDKDLFSMSLEYQAGGNTPQWNGNISQIIFRTEGVKKETHNFTYDALSRLTNVTTISFEPVLMGWGNPNNPDRYNTSYSYDKIGNMLSLTRKGKISASAYGLIDNLAYTYDSNGRLGSITEASVKGLGFKSHSSGSASYAYDQNGNMISDGHKGLSVTYNQLNLPEKFTISGHGDIEVSYDAAGRKHKKKTGQSVNQEYYGMFEYKGGILDAIYHSEGRVNVASGSMNYEFNIKDHLGNTRVTFKEGSLGQAILIDEHHYYAFGMEMDGFNAGVGSDNQYLYNGKELNTDFGLDMLDYGARWYDPSIARFHNVDPLAENYSFQNPFAYAANNPILYIDFMGMGPTTIYKDTKGNTLLDTDDGSNDVVIVEDSQIESLNVYMNIGMADLNSKEWNAFAKKLGTAFDVDSFSEFFDSNEGDTAEQEGEDPNFTDNDGNPVDVANEHSTFLYPDSDGVLTTGPENIQGTSATHIPSEFLVPAKEGSRGSLHTQTATGKNLRYNTGNGYQYNNDPGNPSGFDRAWHVKGNQISVFTTVNSHTFFNKSGTINFSVPRKPVKK